MLLFLSGCPGKPDPRTVDGALAYAAEQLEHGNRRALFRVIDQRSRHCMASIVTDRRAAAALVGEDYPEEARPTALAELGDAVDAADAAALFASRCDRACLDELSTTIGAPRRSEAQGEEVVVDTARGTTLRLHRGDDGWYGLVWHTDELVAERDDASQDLAMVRQNAEIYRRRRELQ